MCVIPEGGGGAIALPPPFLISSQKKTPPNQGPVGCKNVVTNVQHLNKSLAGDDELSRPCIT